MRNIKLGSITILTFFLLITCPFFGQGIQFFKGSIAELKAKAKAESKIIFIDAYTTWCGPCKKMSKNVFPREDVGNFYNKSFISYKLDAEKGEGIQFAKDYGIVVYPTLLFIDANGNMVHRTVGGLSSEKFIELGKAALGPKKRISILEEKFNKGNRDPEFIKEYFATLQRVGAGIASKLDIYLAGLNKEQLISEEAFDFIDKNVKKPEGKSFDILLDNADAFGKLVGKQKVEGKIHSIYFQNYMTNLMKNEGKGNDEIISDIKKRKLAFSAELLIEEAELTALVYKRKPDQFFTRAEKFIANFGPNSPSLLFRMVNLGTFFKDEKLLLPKAINWAEKAIKLGKEDYDIYALYRYMLSVVGDKTKLLKATEKTIEIAKKEGKSVSYLEEELKKLKEQSK